MLRGERDSMLLAKKVAVITGSSRGIGRAIALTFSREGADIVVNYLNSRQLAHEVVDAVESMGGNAFAVQADVSQYSQAERLTEEALDKFHKVDILVNNAGINQDSTLAKMPIEMWNEVLAVNLTGTFNCTKALISHMRERQSGRIINISSVVAQTGAIGTSNYAAAKAGILGFTRAIAREVARRGITVNALALGYFDTGIFYSIPQNIQQDILQQIPMGRLGRAEGVAQVALFLASDASSYITGQVIHVNGGYYM